MKIAICGKMGSGKSYLANEISSYGFYKTSFAKRLKELSIELFGMNDNDKFKDRGLLIDFGSKMREIDSEVWINTMLRDSDKYQNVVLDDLRLSNEYEILKKKGWFIIKLEINEEVRQERLQIKYCDKYNNHILHSDSTTENDVINYDNSKFDLIIYDNNNKDIIERVKRITYAQNIISYGY